MSKSRCHQRAAGAQVSLPVVSGTALICLSVSRILYAADGAAAAEVGPAEADAPAQPSSEPAVGEIGEVIVTARRRAETLQSQPLSIAALNPAEIQSMHIETMSDIASVANVNFNLQPGFSNAMVPFIRGIGEQDPVLTNDQPVAVYVDGVLIARAIGFNFNLLEPQNIEILRGPQGSLFGRNTTGGAVSITLPQPHDTASASTQFDYASNHEILGRVILESGLIGDTGLKALLGFQHHNMDGYVRNRLSEDPSDWAGSDNTNGFYLSLHGDLPAGIGADLRADYSKSINTIVSGQLSDPTPAVVDFFGNSPSFGGDPFVYSSTRLDSLYIGPTRPHSYGQFGGTSLTLNVPFSDAFALKSISAFRKFSTQVQPNTVAQGNLIGPYLDANFNPNVGFVTPYTLQAGIAGRDDVDDSGQFQLSQEFQFTGKVAQHNFVAGLYAFDEQVHETYTSMLDVLTPTVPGVGIQVVGGVAYKARSESFAAYASDSYTPPILDNKLELTGGVRYTMDRKWIDYLQIPQLPPDPANVASKHASFAKPSGDFTAKYQWTPDFMTYLRFANAYKSGGFSGRDAPQAPGFQPEIANNYEIGEKLELLNRRLLINADAFYTQYTDKQITTFAPGLSSNGINASHTVNAGKARYPGVEVEVKFIPAKFVSFDASYGHVSPKFTQFLTQPVATAPPVNVADYAKFQYTSNTSYSIGTTLTQPTPVGELSGRLEFSYKSGMYFHPLDEVPASVLPPGSPPVGNVLNEAIKAGSQNILNANITLAHIAQDALHADLSVAVYGRNLLNKEYTVQAVDYSIVPGYDEFATRWFARPRVVGVELKAKF